MENEITKLTARKALVHDENIIPADEVEARLIAARNDLEAVAEKHGLHVFLGSFALQTTEGSTGHILVSGCRNCAVHALEALAEQVMEAHRRTEHLAKQNRRKH